MMARDAARELRADLVDPWHVVERLGLVDGRASFVRQSRGVIIRCPWHADRTPSCSVRVADDGTIGVRCHACQASGDVLSLVAVARSLDVRRDFPDVLRAAAEIAGRFDLLAEEHETRPQRRRPPQPRPRRVVRERTYPAADELAAVLARATPVSDDAEACAMLEKRRLDPVRIDDLGLARVVPRDADVPGWARYRGRPWTTTGHRLLLPVVDAAGEVRSVRAWRVTEGDSPKRLPPAGHRASGLILACPFARAMLGADRAEAVRVVVAEGEPDFLTWASRFSDADEDAPVVLGVLSGSWGDDFASRLPSGSQVVIRTHHDAAGQQYAEAIGRSLRGRCRLRRAPEVS